MLNNKTSAAWAACLLLLCLSTQAHGQKKTSEIIVPANLKLSLTLLSPLSTTTNKKGDKFSCKVLSPAEYAGATVEGHVQKAKRSGKATGKSEMILRFDTITLVDGRVGSFNASVVEVFDVVDAGSQGRADNEGTVKGKSTVKRDAVKIATGAVIGAIIGGILGGGQGAAIGAAIGAAAAVSTTLATRGPDLEFKQGTQFTVVLNSPSRLIGVAEASPQVAVNESKGPAPQAPVLADGKTENQKDSGETESIESPATASPSTTTKAPTAAPARVVPKGPSKRYRTYTGANLFRMDVPTNWRESGSNNPVTFAPDGGYIFHESRPNLTHGVMVGVASGGSPDLQVASEQFVNALIQNNSYLQKQGSPQGVEIAGRGGLVTRLYGISAVTGRVESLAVYTLVLKSGGMFYLIAVVPQDEQGNYEGVFRAILGSVRLND